MPMDLEWDVIKNSVGVVCRWPNGICPYSIFVCVVCIPPSGNATRAAGQITDCVH